MRVNPFFIKKIFCFVFYMTSGFNTIYVRLLRGAHSVEAGLSGFAGFSGVAGVGLGLRASISSIGGLAVQAVFRRGLRIFKLENGAQLIRFQRARISL